jgi:predicted MFS family arabinose efflux permease
MTLIQATTLPDPQQSAPRSFIRLGALATGVIITNLFAPQILVGLIGSSLGMSETQASMVSTLTLFGYSLGLFLLVPLADIFENRRLIVLTLCCTVVAATCTALAPTPMLLLLCVFLLGASCSAIQMLVPLVASMAHPSERGRVIGDVMGGLMVGLLLSRPAASFIADVWDWRGFYAASAVAIAILAVALTWRLPSLQPAARMSYMRLLGSFWVLWRNEPILRVRSWTAALSMAAFSAFWAAIALRLAAAPFNLSPSAIAIFALVGAAGAIATPLAGRMGDRGWTRPALCISHGLIVLSLALASWAEFISSRTTALIVLSIGAILLDVGVTGDQILGRHAVNLLQPEARGRINGLFVGIFFIGGGIGAATAGFAWIHGGWPMVCLAAAAFGILALITDAITSLGT